MGIKKQPGPLPKGSSPDHLAGGKFQPGGKLTQPGAGGDKPADNIQK